MYRILVFFSVSLLLLFIMLIALALS